MKQTQTSDIQTGSSLAALGVVELVPDRLYVLGNSIKLDGRISWVPEGASGWQPINAYLLCEDGEFLIIDPGIYAQHEIVRRQLDALIKPGSAVSIYLTRAEPDAAGNIGEVGRRYPVKMLYAGGGPNPFDAFEAVELLDPKSKGNRIQMERMPPGLPVPVGGTRGLEVLRPIIRLLATYWAYDLTTRTLFTSDSFSHALQDAPGGPRVLTSTASRWAELPHVRAHLLAKFGWLRGAKTQSILKNLREMRGLREIDRIAPSRGMIIEGRGAVAQHLDAMETVLEELSQ